MEQQTNTSVAQKREERHWEAIALELGITVERLKTLSYEEIDELVEQKVGKLKYGLFVGGLIPRGNPLLGIGRFIDHVKLMRRFNKVFG
ncbi:MAG: hypothetical protein IPL64_13855 [Flavobacteriales bacterium]|nr:hypothetical protein [Flavobacteriales bacterium]